MTRGFLSDLAIWWSDVMRGMSGNAGNRTAACRRLAVARDGLRLGAGEGSADSPICEADLAMQLRALPTGGRRRQPDISVTFEPGGYVLRQLSRIAVPRSRARAMAELDLAGSTPFRAVDVHALLVEPEQQTNPAPAYYAIVKRPVLDGIIAAARSAGSRIGQLRFDTPAGSYILSKSEAALLLQPARARARNLAWTGATLALAFAIAGTLLHVHAVYARAQLGANAHMERVGADAKAVRQALDASATRHAEVAALRNRIASIMPMAAVWEELTRVLPDSSYLTDMTVKDGKVSIAGYSSEASSIVIALEGSPHFDAAQFTAPVVKVPGQDGEQFAIDLVIAGK